MTTTRISLYKIVMLSMMMFASYGNVFAAKITFIAPTQAPRNDQSFVVRVFLDTEQEEVSGVAANFSFPENLFTIDSIVLDDSIVSLWVKQPSVSLEKSFDGMTHITFEGIFPGGFQGVLSPTYKGYKPGILFTILLKPKEAGSGYLGIQDVTLHRYDASASEINVDNSFQHVSVPKSDKEYQAIVSYKQVDRPKLTVTVNRDDLIDERAWYMFVQDEDARSAIQSISLAETDSWYPPTLDDSLWRTALTNPVLLQYQTRTKYIHVKVVYADHTFTIKTLPPVENSNNSSHTSRILISISIVLVLLYVYAHKQARSKKHKEKHPSAS